jgi:hypothetical protein
MLRDFVSITHEFVRAINKLKAIFCGIRSLFDGV